MRQGLSSAEDGILLIKPKQNNENYPVGGGGGGGLSWPFDSLCRAGLRHNQKTYDGELTQDYKHKENK